MNDVGKKLGHSQKWLIKADISENGEVGSSIDTHQKKKKEKQNLWNQLCLKSEKILKVYGKKANKC